MDVNYEYLQSLRSMESPDATFFSTNPSLVIESGSASYLKDVEGNTYIDMCAGFASCILGHNHPCHKKVFNEYAVANEGFGPLVQGLGDVFASKIKVDFIKYLISLLPSSLTKASLSLSGSQAVETAIKTAILYTKKSGIICLKGCYHGLDFGTLNLNDKPFFKKDFASWLNENNVFFCDYNNENIEQQVIEARKYFAKNNIELAAILVEPIQGRAGVKPANLSWLQTLKNICEDNHCLLIYDEIFTGLGRTGQITFANDVPCDILCLGKALGGGMPISCCIGTDKVMNAWPENTGEAIHTGTFYGHPLSCQLGLATLHELVQNKLCQRSKNLGDSFLNKLKNKLEGKTQVKDIRGKGLMVAIEFKDTSFGVSFADQLRKEKIIAIPSGVFGECISFSPALNIEEKILDEVVETLGKLL